MNQLYYQIPENEAGTTHQKSYEKEPGTKVGTCNVSSKQFVILSFGYVYVVVPSNWVNHLNQ